MKIIAGVLTVIVALVSAGTVQAAPPTPEGLRGTAKGGPSVVNELQWTPVDPQQHPDVLGYRVYERIGAKPMSTPFLRRSGPENFVSLGAKRGRDYFYNVTSFTATEESPPAEVEVFQRPYARDNPTVRDCTQGAFKPGCSPWNQRIPAGASLYDDPGTPTVNEGQQIANQLATWNVNDGKDIPWNPLTMPADAPDFQRPVYYAKLSDPEYTIQCNRFGGACEIASANVRIPMGAQPAAGGCTRQEQIDETCAVDGHLSVVQPDGSEFDLWQSEVPSGVTGDTLDVSFGGKTHVAEDGLWSNATALQSGALGGSVTAYEQAAGEINHALAMGVPCVRSDQSFVYPANGNADRCGGPGTPRTGERIRLNPNHEVNSSLYPAWLKPWLRALQRYGAYVVDTGGASTFGLRQLSDQTYTSFLGGGEGSYYRYIAGIDTTSDDGITFSENDHVDPNPDFDDTFILNLRQGTWVNDLQVIDPCVTQKTCSRPSPPQPPPPPPSPSPPASAAPPAAPVAEKRSKARRQRSKARPRCVVPRLRGLRVSHAKRKLRRARCRYRVRGKGRVVSTSPRRGTRTRKTVFVRARHRG
jgi:hypothetical protein